VPYEVPLYLSRAPLAQKKLPELATSDGQSLVKLRNLTDRTSVELIIPFDNVISVPLSTQNGHRPLNISAD